jgi:hypothetical protein
LGYSPATALADVIDNSISAGAANVWLNFAWDGERSAISILDDGIGMDEDELERAMRLGDRNPLDERSASDLGRFGLGLKTSSFSQCRSLTVISRRSGRTSCLRWDLDVLKDAGPGEWPLLVGPADRSDHHLRIVDGIESGTLVLWEKMDRIVGPGFREKNFLDLIDAIDRHLSMVFHRYVSGPSPKLKIHINGIAIRPWDPFLASHPATWSSPEERLMTSSGMVEVQCHVLPHRDRLEPKLFDLAAGPDGWTAQQGFYVYRNERLLVAGSWLGLGTGRAWTKEEAHRLARIRLDIPNTADADWKIDIRKSTARPPVWIRNRLVQLAEDTRARARRVFAHRGAPARNAVGGEVTAAWRTDRFQGGVRYRIDDAHPAVRAVLDEAGQNEPMVRAMLRVLEETIPVQRIWLDTTEAKETPRTSFAGEPSNEVVSVLRTLYRNLVRKKGLSADRARATLLATEPFQNFPDLVGSLPDDPD